MALETPLEETGRARRRSCHIFQGTTWAASRIFILFVAPGTANRHFYPTARNAPFKNHALWLLTRP
eukprot:6409955-Lingulodinium_polyedra.AAC.1